MLIFASSPTARWASDVPDNPTPAPQQPGAPLPAQPTQPDTAPVVTAHCEAVRHDGAKWDRQWYYADVRRPFTPPPPPKSTPRRYDADASDDEADYANVQVDDAGGGALRLTFKERRTAQTRTWWQFWCRWVLPYLGVSCAAGGAWFGAYTLYHIDSTLPTPAHQSAPVVPSVGGHPCRELLEKWRASRTWGTLTPDEKRAADAAIQAEGGR